MKTQKFCLIILFCLFFSSLALADEWTIVGQLNVGRDQGCQSVLLPGGQSVLITGGLPTGSIEPTASCEIFDFETNQSIFINSLPTPVSGHCLIELDLDEAKEYLTIVKGILF